MAPDMAATFTACTRAAEAGGDGGWPELQDLDLDTALEQQLPAQLQQQLAEERMRQDEHEQVWGPETGSPQPGWAGAAIHLPQNSS